MINNTCDHPKKSRYFYDVFLTPYEHRARPPGRKSQISWCSRDQHHTFLLFPGPKPQMSGAPASRGQTLRFPGRPSLKS